MSFEIIGVHPVPFEEPVHLIEAQIRGFTGKFDFGLLVQPDPNLPETHWQVAWRPYLLSSGGNAGAPYLDFEPIEISGEQRFSFFLHYTNSYLPISTPFGEIPLPSESPLPSRLNFVRYESVD